VFLRAADVNAAAEIRIVELVDAGLLDQLPGRQAGLVQRLALEPGLRKDLFGVGRDAALDGGASRQRRETEDNEAQAQEDARRLVADPSLVCHVV